MKSWTDLEPDRYRLLTRNYTPGRGGRSIKYVVIHHNAGVLSIDQIWEVWQTREASAHYQVTTAGEIGQLVNDSDTAWHAANLQRNQESIGIEHSNSAGAAADWPISEKTLEEGAHLVAAICRYYGLGRPQWGVNVRPHSETGQTSCPYHLSPNGKYGQSYIKRAQYWYDQIGSPTPVPTPAPTPSKETTVSDLTTKYFTDFITGYLGPQIKALQEIWQAVLGQHQSEYTTPAGERSQWKGTLIGFIKQLDRKQEDIHANMLPRIWDKLNDIETELKKEK
ncbi:peptidoglycan recognition protein family protein [Corynebacterium flavescens]|uniref:peptidoglycan recognition protein family protein n=1 Tax=Corynebacterium flavescens TaxID=28028 RepID=UPI00289E3E41|nr:peptidoglycan recognition family protein [Corynebacterium flavescens]